MSDTAISRARGSSVRLPGGWSIHAGAGLLEHKFLKTLGCFISRVADCYFLSLYTAQALNNPIGPQSISLDGGMARGNELPD